MINVTYSNEISSVKKDHDWESRDWLQQRERERYMYSTLQLQLQQALADRGVEWGEDIEVEAVFRDALGTEFLGEGQLTGDHLGAAGRVLPRRQDSRPWKRRTGVKKHIIREGISRGAEWFKFQLRSTFQ